MTRIQELNFMEIEESNHDLINDLVTLIERSKNQLAYAANATMT